MANKITTLLDLDAKGFTSSAKSVRQQIAETDGTFNKLKAGGKGMFASLQANAGAFAIAGGAALAAFGAKAVSAFQDVALEAGKFADATGLAVEDASRWLEVAGDLGIEASTVEGLFTKMNKAIGAGGESVEKFGIHLITAADGTADVNQTMLTAIQRIGAIKDPTERAQAAQEVFGKSYKDAAELIFDSADNVKKKLDEVSDAKVIDAEELEKARKFRAALDDLKDVVEDLTITAGEELVPALTDVAESVKDISDTANDLKIPELLKFGTENTALHRVRQLGGAVKDMFGKGGDAAEAIKYTTTAQDQYVESLEQSHSAVLDAADAEEAHADSVAKSLAVQEGYIAFLTSKAVQVYYDIQHAVDRARRANKLFTDGLEKQREEVQRQIDTLHDYETSQYDTADAVQNLHDTLEDADSTLEDARRAQLDAADAAYAQATAFAEATGASDGSTASYLAQKEELQRLKEKFPELSADIDDYIAKLNQIPGVVSTQLLLTANGRAYTAQLTGASGRIIDAGVATQPRPSAGTVGFQRAATGGIVKATPGGTPVIVGEGGKDEAIIPLSQGGGMGATYNFTLNVQQALGPKDVVELVKKYERTDGAGWRGA